MAQSKLKGQGIQSGLYRTFTNSEFTTTSTTMVDATGWSIASVILPVASDIEIEIFIDYQKNSTVGNGQNTYQILYGSTVIGALIYKTTTGSNVNECLLLRRTILNLAAGTYTFKLQTANNAAGTITIGTGEMTVKVRAN